MNRSDACPLVEELSPPPEPEEAFRRLAARPGCLFLDSAMRDPTLGRYSFLAADPFETFKSPVAGTDCLGELARRMARFESATATLEGLPPFQGGAAGLLGYELSRQIETLPVVGVDDFQFPTMAVGFYDVVVAWDHVEDRCWILSQGLPELEPGRRRRRAAERLAKIRDWLFATPTSRSDDVRRPNVTVEQLARQYPLNGQYAPEGHAGLSSNFSADGYLNAVRRAIEYVFAGDIFQVNLAQRLLCPARDDSVSLYFRLRRRNPAPFAGYFDLGDFQIASASPERFLRLARHPGGTWQVETRPIKGTRPRVGEPERDRLAREELLASEKDRSENVMIVDLLRNDLSRVCEPDSVLVTQLCQVETYQYVQHLVSAVEGRLRDGLGPIDLLRAAFPGGSITGAPKIRAMEIVAELEPTARGAYCGSLGYLGFDGAADWSILIRTITAGRGWWQLPVGGGIVAQSDPRQEYEETWHKAEGMIQALE